MLVTSFLLPEGAVRYAMDVRCRQARTFTPEALSEGMLPTNAFVIMAQNQAPVKHIFSRITLRL